MITGQKSKRDVFPTGQKTYPDFDPDNEQFTIEIRWDFLEKIIIV
jgi:hypothetical protein